MHRPAAAGLQLPNLHYALTKPETSTCPPPPGTAGRAAALTVTGVALADQPHHQGGAVAALSGAGEGLDAELVCFRLQGEHRVARGTGEADERPSSSAQGPDPGMLNRACSPWGWPGAAPTPPPRSLSPQQPLLTARVWEDPPSLDGRTAPGQRRERAEMQATGYAARRS